MNKIFKVVWSKTKNSYVVVSEIAKRNGKCSSSLNKKLIAAFLAAGTVLSVTGSAWAADVVYTNESLPTGNYDHPEDVVTITQNSDCSSDVSSPIYVTQDTTINTKDLIIDNSQRTSISTRYPTYNGSAIFINGGPLTLSSDSLSIVSSKYGIYYKGSGDGETNKVNMTLADESSIKVSSTLKEQVAIDASHYGSVSVTSTNGNLISGVDGSAATSMYSLRAHDNGEIILKSGKDITISTNQTHKSKGSTAIFAYNAGNNIEINAAGNVNISAISSKKSATGIDASGAKSTVKVTAETGDIWINYDGPGDTIGVNSHGGADVKLKAPKGTVGITSPSKQAVGIMVQTHSGSPESATLEIESKNFELKLDNSVEGWYAIFPYGPKSTVRITTEGDNSIFANDAVGIVAGWDIFMNARTGKAYINGVNNTIESNTIGIYGLGEGYIELNADGNNTIRNASVPIKSRNKSEVVLEAKGDNIIESSGETAIYTLEESKVSVSSGVVTKIKGNVKVETGGSITVESPSTLLEGDITAATGGKVEMNSFTDSDSKMTGKVTTDEESSTELTFSDGATWNMTESSNVSNLVFKNAVIDMTTTEGNKSLTIDKSFTGDSGTFKMNLKYGSGSDHPLYKAEDVTDSDYIFALNSSSGTYDIQYDTGKANLDAMEKGDKLYFSYVEGNSAQYTSSSTEEYKRDDPSEVYVYKYAVENENSDNGKTGKNWYITLTKDEPEPEPEPTPGPQPDPKPQPKPQPKPSSAVEIISDMGYSNYALGAELDRLNKRMGEARYIDEERGAWVRIKRGRQDIDNAFRNNYTMVQVGTDAKVKPHKDKGKHYRGAALGYTDASTSLMRFSGHGDVKRFTIEGYDTWLGHKGHYRDIVARFGRLESEYSAFGRTGKEISADYENNFGSLSIEYGRKKDMGNEWYFEPQVQLQVARVGSASYTTKQGLWNRQDAITSIIARGGFRIGRDILTDKNKLRRSYYFKADIMHEFDGDRTMFARSADGLDTLRTDHDGKRTWADVGLGADLELNNNSYFFLDMERAFGNGVSRTWQVNGGFRWEWK